MFSYTILNHDLSMKFWNISNPTAGYKSFLFYWALLLKVDILCPPDVWKTSCCIEVVTLCLAVGAAAQVDHKRHTWSAVWNSCFFSVVILSLVKNPNLVEDNLAGPESKQLGRRRRRKREEKGGRKDEEKDRNMSRLLISGDGTGRRSEGNQRD